MTDPNRNIVLSDIDIPFGRLVILFIKFGLAAIPAGIVVWLIMVIVFAILGGVLGGFGFMTGMMGGRGF